jgi:hypothetical protein
MRRQTDGLLAALLWFTVRLTSVDHQSALVGHINDLLGRETGPAQLVGATSDDLSAASVQSNISAIRPGDVFVCFGAAISQSAAVEALSASAFCDIFRPPTVGRALHSDVSVADADAAIFLLRDRGTWQVARGSLSSAIQMNPDRRLPRLTHPKFGWLVDINTSLAANVSDFRRTSNATGSCLKGATVWRRHFSLKRDDHHFHEVPR